MHTLLGLRERIGDPHRRDEILVVSRVSHERPPVPVRLPEVARNRRAHEALLAAGASQSIRELGCLIDHAGIGPLDVLLFLFYFGVWPAPDNAGPIVVGRPDREGAMVADVGLEATVHGEPAPVRVIGREELRLLLV